MKRLQLSLFPSNSDLSHLYISILVSLGILLPEILENVKSSEDCSWGPDNRVGQEGRWRVNG
jgi:hypothetical protein